MKNYLVTLTSRGTDHIRFFTVIALDENIARELAEDMTSAMNKELSAHYIPHYYDVVGIRGFC